MKVIYWCGVELLMFYLANVQPFVCAAKPRLLRSLTLTLSDGLIHDNCRKK